MPASQQERKAALEALAERRRNKPQRIDSSDPDSPVYYYCASCGHIVGGCVGVLPEGYPMRPPQLCKACQALNDLGWLE